MKSHRWILTTLLIASCLTLVSVPGWSRTVPHQKEAVRYIYLIRHGDYDHADKADSRTGKHLNTIGHEQARFAGARLALLSFPFNTFVSSEYTRARETADDIGELIRRTPARDSLLNECTPLSSRDSAKGVDSKAAQCTARLETVWGKYMRPAIGGDSVDVLVCHGNVIRWLVSRSLSGDGTLWRGMNIGNASLTVIAVREDGSTRVATFSDVGHIPTEKQTWTGDGPGWESKVGEADS